MHTMTLRFRRKIFVIFVPLDQTQSWLAALLLAVLASGSMLSTISQMCHPLFLASILSSWTLTQSRSQGPHSRTLGLRSALLAQATLSSSQTSSARIASSAMT